MKSDNRIFGLDVMRATAILFVVFSHIKWVVPQTEGFFSDAMGLSGFLGVEIFFVLSGFLIGRILYNSFNSEEFSFKSVFYFWIRRWFRTLPNYYLVLGLNILIAIYLGIEFPKHLWYYIFFIHNLVWKMPDFFPESWSLSIEEFAYIIGPLLLYFSLFFKTKFSRSKLFLGITVLIISFFTITKFVYTSLYTTENMNFWNLNLKAVVFYRIDAIYYGVLAAYISKVKPKFWAYLKYKSVFLGITIIFGLNMLITAQNIFIETHSWFWNLYYLPINTIAIMFMLPLLSQWNKTSKFISRPITFLSLISYSMYLLHYSVILQLLKFYLPTENLGILDTVIYVLVYLSLTIISSYFLYAFYEKPIMNFRDKPFFTKTFLNN